MNVYLEHAGALKNYRHIRALKRLMKPKESVELYIRSKGRVSLMGLVFLAALNPHIRNMELTIDISKVSAHMITFANASPSFSLRYSVCGPLRPQQWKRASRLRSTIYVEDSTDSANRHLYESCRRVIWSDKGHDGIGISEAYATAVKKPLKSCRFSSCLGKTVYVSARGELAFCPVYPEQTAMGHIRSTEKLFQSELFAQCLSGMIGRRAMCKRSCPRFAECLGGCPFDGDCSSFRKSCDLAQQDIENLIDQRCDLSAVSLHQEQAIIYRLFSRK